MHQLENAALTGKYKEIRFVKANSIIDTQTSITESSSKAIIYGEEIRSFYETMLAEPSASVASDIVMTKELQIIKNSYQHSRKFTKLLTNMKEQGDIKKNLEQFFKDAANGNVRSVMDYHCREGMDINVSDQYGWTALMCASYAGHLHIVKYLLSVGADISKRSKSGESAADFALKCGHDEIYRIRCELSSRKIKRSRKILDSACFCDACQCNYVGEAHLSSVAHLLETRKPVLDPGYGIPVWNKGYRILRRSGWDEFEGLGRDATGRRYPIKTVLKRDKLGLGYIDIPKMTHFKANGVKIRPATKGEEIRDHKNE
ncbi:hypothetical protein DINM_005511 [Dirofilaria immitis]|nr:hypothetical protein [Dirofilaria immitis]